MLKELILDGCSLGDAPIINWDKFSKSQFSQTDLEREVMKQISYACGWKFDVRPVHWYSPCNQVLGRFQKNLGMPQCRVAKKAMRYLFYDFIPILKKQKKAMYQWRANVWTKDFLFLFIVIVMNLKWLVMHILILSEASIMQTLHQAICLNWLVGRYPEKSLKHTITILSTMQAEFIACMKLQFRQYGWRILILDWTLLILCPNQLRFLTIMPQMCFILKQQQNPIASNILRSSILCTGLKLRKDN